VTDDAFADDGALLFISWLGQARAAAWNPAAAWIAKNSNIPKTTVEMLIAGRRKRLPDWNNRVEPLLIALRKKVMEDGRGDPDSTLGSMSNWKKAYDDAQNRRPASCPLPALSSASMASPPRDNGKSVTQDRATKHENIHGRPGLQPAGSALETAGVTHRHASNADPGHSLIMGRWRQPGPGDSSMVLVTIRDNERSFHPDIVARSSRRNAQHTVALGIDLPSNPIHPVHPATTDLRTRFLDFLSQPPLSDLIGTIGAIDVGANWAAWGGHGRTVHEAVLAGPDGREPVAWGRLWLPHPQVTSSWGFLRAEFYLEMDWRTSQGATASPLDFIRWHHLFMQMLTVPSALSCFLVDNLGLTVPDKKTPTPPLEKKGTSIPPARVVAWLVAPNDLSDLVDISGYRQLRGYRPPWFKDYAFMTSALSDIHGSDAVETAIEWTRQMCDTLGLDGYESTFETLWSK
jgi:hypothetical protein